MLPNFRTKVYTGRKPIHTKLLKERTPMPYELKSARYLARDALLQAVNAGDTVVDATP